MNNYRETLILGIETSCDETAVAIVADGKRIVSNLVSSQIDIHARFGGVVPEIASRLHLEILNPLIDAALEDAKTDLNAIDALAVSYGPGLVGALLVGVSTAKSLAYVLKKPLIAINHLEGHLYANYLQKDFFEDNLHREVIFPVMGLVVSGGHTDLVWMPEEGNTQIIGSTRDDAAGEAFDKVARALKLGYPGGPVIDKLAGKGNSKAVNLPRAYLDEEGRFDFSFSGLKSAVLNYLHKNEKNGVEINVSDVAASFQKAVVDVLVTKSINAVIEKKPESFFLSGGVAANSYLRDTMKNNLKRIVPDVMFFCPMPEFCTDNAAMIAAAAFYHFKKENFSSLDLNAVPNLSLQN